MKIFWKLLDDFWSWKFFPINPTVRGKKVLGKKVPEKAFSVKEMTGKFTVGSWTFFKFLSIGPTQLPHTHKKMLNVHPTIPHAR